MTMSHLSRIFPLPLLFLILLTSQRTYALCGTSPPPPSNPKAAAKDAVFPVSLRATLLKKAQELDDNLQFPPIVNDDDNDSTTTTPTPTTSFTTPLVGSYSPSGWSNRLGTALTPAAPGVYTGDRPFYWNNIDVGSRMTIIQLQGSNNSSSSIGDGDNNHKKTKKMDLWVHSPIGLDAATKAAVDRLGTVKYVVSPNYEHVKYAEQWNRAYPDAFMWACPGLMERMPQVTWEGELPCGIDIQQKHQQRLSSSSTQSGEDDTTTSNCWDFDEITPLHLDFEVNPFTGKPFFNEVIFWHRPSQTLITTDLYWNYPTDDGVPFPNGSWELAPAVQGIPPGSRLWKRGMDQIFLPFYKKLMVRNKESYNEMVRTVLQDWDVELIIPAHGDLVRGKDVVRSTLTQHFATNS